MAKERERERDKPEEERHESGRPSNGKGRRDETGRSGVYPASGPLPPGNPPIRTQAEWGQGERGAAGYEDHGESELTAYWEEVDRGREERRERENKEGKEEERK